MRGRGQESRHNLTYWRYGDYAGIGPGAHGRRLGMRTVRHRKPENFLSALRATATASPRRRRSRRRRLPTKRWSWACAFAKASMPDAIAQRFGLARDCRLGAGRAAGRAQATSTRDGARIALTAAGRLLLDYILGEIAVAEA